MQEFDPFKAKGGPSFLDKIKKEKKAKEQNKQKLEASLKIINYYRRTKEYVAIKREIFKKSQEKINKILLLKDGFLQKGKLADFQQTCSVALLKYIDILQPIYFLRIQYQYMDNFEIIQKFLLLLINGVQCKNDNMNFFQLIFFQQKKYQAQSFYVKRLIKICIQIVDQKITQISNEFIISIQSLLKNNQQLKTSKNLFIQTFFPIKIDFYVELILNNYKTDSLTGYCYLLKKLAQITMDPDFLLLYILQSPNKLQSPAKKFQQIQFKIVHSQLLQKLLADQENFIGILRVYFYLRSLWGSEIWFQQSVEDMRKYLLTMTQLITYLEKKYINQFILCNKQIQVMEIEGPEESKTQSINKKVNKDDLKFYRKNKQYQKFLSEIDVDWWFEQVVLNQLAQYCINQLEFPLITSISILLKILKGTVIQNKFLHIQIFLNTKLFEVFQYFIPFIKDQQLINKNFYEENHEFFFILSQFFLQQIQSLDDEQLSHAMQKIFNSIYFFRVEKQNIFSVNNLQIVSSLFLNTLYQSLKNKVKLRESQKGISMLLTELYMRDDRVKFTPNGFWEINDANYYLKIKSEDDLVIKDIIQRMPFVLSFENRVFHFQKSIEEDKKGQSRNPAQLYRFNDDGGLEVDMNRILEVRRKNELEDALDQLENKNIKSLYHVKFINEFGVEEVGIDAGGITKEFVMRVVKQILCSNKFFSQAFNPELGLFKESKQSTFIPNPYFFQEDLKKYEFVGKMIGKAFYEGVLIEPIISRAFLNIVLGRKNSFNDLKYYDVELYNSLSKLSKDKSPHLGLTFSITEEVYGALKEIELKPNGSNIDVTQENKQEFIWLYSNFRLNTQVKKIFNNVWKMVRQSQYFRKGLASVINVDLFSMFNHKELQLLISGSPQLNVDELRKYTIYNGFRETDKTIIDFWNVLKKFSIEEQQKFLHFVTSCSRAPTLGFKALDPPFCIQKCISQSQDDYQKLPTAQTCFNILKMPDYQNLQLLRVKLLQSINSNGGFELT